MLCRNFILSLLQCLTRVFIAKDIFFQGMLQLKYHHLFAASVSSHPQKYMYVNKLQEQEFILDVQ